MLKNMDINRVFKLGFYMNPMLLFPGFSIEVFMNYVSDRKNMHGRILLLLDEYFVKHSKIFDETYFYYTTEPNKKLPNETLTGLK